MNTRIYPKESFDKAVRQYEVRTTICPRCYSKDIRLVDSKFDWVNEFECKKCDHKFNKEQSLTVESLRNKKIDDILK
jgi:transposase-like protein